MTRTTAFPEKDDLAVLEPGKVNHPGHHIVVYNDDVNTFEHVIACFVKILAHSPIQAEQCAYIINDKGNCSVKNGDKSDLLVMKDQLLDQGIEARVETKPKV